MNKQEAIKIAKGLQSKLDFIKEESEKEIKRLSDELYLYKKWFKASQRDNEMLKKQIK